MELVPLGKRHLKRPRRRWEDNDRMNQEINVRAKNCVDSVYDRDYWRGLVNSTF